MSLIFYTDDHKLVSWQSASGVFSNDSLRYEGETGFKNAGLSLYRYFICILFAKNLCLFLENKF